MPARDDSEASGVIVFLHSSDELYGADRILLDLLEALPPGWRKRAQFWLPTDVPHGPTPLCTELRTRGATVVHLDLPVLRRAYRTPRQLARLSLRALRLRRQLRRAHADIVYCTTSATFLAAPVARSAGARVVGHVQELWSRSDTLALSPMARALHRVVAISGPVRAGLPTSLRRRCEVVLNATRPPPRHVPLTGRDGPLRFVVASRWNGWKGHRTLLAAWDRLESPGELVVLGGPPSSGESVDVPALVDGLRRPDSVRVVGEVPEVDPYLEEADVVVVPSDRPEPFGLVAIEAFARGRPVVASDGGGLADIISHGQDGWLYPPGETGALTDVLGSLTREQATRAGATARATYERRFTATRYAAQWRRATGLG